MLLILHSILSEYGSFTQKISLVLVARLWCIHRKKLGISRLPFPLLPQRHRFYEQERARASETVECNARHSGLVSLYFFACELET